MSYNAANQLLGMTWNSISETRTYNSLNQLTNVADSQGSFYQENLTYNYPAGANNGKASSIYNAVSGETVTYTYDSLNRIATAAGSGWNETYAFDGFGNLTAKSGTPGNQVYAVDPATNRLGTTDANGNASTVTNGNNTYNLYYDAENRLTTAGYPPAMYYSYDSQNRRMGGWSGGTDSSGNATGYTVNVYTPGGQKLGAYQIQPQVQSGHIVLFATLGSSDQYFGGRRLAVMDQLGSSGAYFPWGEPRSGAGPQDTWNFATYWADSATGLDYAMNRYYSNAYGRFMTPDPYKANAGGPGDPRDPQSWNRYQYVVGDPVNRIDPTGRDWCDPEDPNCDPEDPVPPPFPITPAPPLPVVTFSCDVQVFAQKIAGLPGGYHTYVQTIVDVTVNGVTYQDTQIFQATDQTKATPQVQCSRKAAALGQCWLNNISSPPVISVGSSAPGNLGGTQIYDSGFSASECGNVSAIEASSGIYPNNTNVYNGLFQNSNSFVYTLLELAGVPTSTVFTNALSDGIPLVGWGITVPFF